MIQGLDKRNSDNLLQWLIYELQRTRADRTPLESDWIRYEEVYRSKPHERVKDFPFKGAANVVIPLAATDVDTTVAGLMGTLFGSPNLWSCEGLRPDMLDVASAMEEFLEWAQEQELGMYAVAQDFVTELCKLGTSIMKQRYKRETKQMWEWRETQGQTLKQMVRRIASDRPDVSHVPLANFYTPGTTTKLVDASWCAERLTLTWNQLESRVRAGIYENDFLNKIGAFWRGQQVTSHYSRFQRAQEQLDNFVPGVRDTFELFEFWTNYDILGTGEPVAVVCTVHEPSQSYGRIDFNPFFHQEYPYSVARFLKQSDRFYGIGLCEMLEIAQEIVSTQENQRLDNGTIRNTAVMKGRRGVGIKQDEPIWPGRIMLMDNPETDLIPMNIGFPADSTLEEEQFIVNYFRERSQVSDYQRGGAGNPSISYSTATTTVAMLQQGKLRLDQVLREIRMAFEETGQRVAELYQQYNQGGKPYLVMGPKQGQLVEQFMKFPLDTIRLGVAVKVTATSAQLNKETRIRTDQIIFGLLTQFYQQLFQGMELVVNPQVPMPLRVLAGQMVEGGLVLARRILQAYELKDIDLILPDLEQMSATIQQLESISPSQQGGSRVGPGSGQPSGFSALAAGFTRAPLAALPPASNAA